MFFVNREFMHVYFNYIFFSNGYVRTFILIFVAAPDMSL